MNLIFITLILIFFILVLFFILKKRNKKDELNIYDLTDVFDQEIRQTYIDSGHLNILGNYLVSKKIAQIILDR